MGAIKPMMFTMFFIIAIFAWIGTAVENFRVSYVSLPWSPEWDLLDGRFLFFPAWIAAYICMSAPLGRVVDRHIKLVRYKTHPIVDAGEKLKEPLLHLVSTPKSSGKQANNRRRRSEQRRSGPRKTESKKSEEKSESKSESKSMSYAKNNCPECGSSLVERDGPTMKLCKVCRHEWR